MAAPLLQAQVEIKAPVAKVWRLVTDFSRMPEWSPQCRMMKPMGPLRLGTRTVNLNRLFLPTTSTVTEVIPERKLAFRINANHTVWSYELEPTPDGTRLVESRHAENGVTLVSKLVVNLLFGGFGRFDIELLDGMNQSLARIKTAAESDQKPCDGALG
jgi:uncharacterized protein YndB with AHSA1/START domain